eukprot:CAMPEP_0174864112 /NCGR_PEP_ID=MMETSP1114-20130205/57734_1 /TAXON_ID=312471 /ORGANISM="Neobodo designis, Strain CCAP 1951/1" /LENGTH=78 /DNA_ID=CAMNT_0016099199 /DNA_START=132 /DNA_END=364 /DNA_ORIENTATION=+
MFVCRTARACCSPAPSPTEGNASRQCPSAEFATMQSRHSQRSPVVSLVKLSAHKPRYAQIPEIGCRPSKQAEPREHGL